MAKKIKTERKVESVIRPYELMLILSPELRETEITKKLKEITDMIEKAGGKITSEDFWGKKTLAYKIQKHLEGIYMVYNTELPSQFLTELKNYLRIEKDVLRSMIINIPGDYTYVKYDIKNMAEEKSKKPARTGTSGERRNSQKNISIKHNSPIIQPKKKEEVIEKKTEDKKEIAEEKTKEIKDEVKKEEKKEESKENKERESELDKKLDEILGGEDLKL